MLKFLSVENFALVDRLEIEFRPGLTLITGETGSGKSILVDAVGLLAGERASQEMVREGFEKARVEGIFGLTAEHPARVLIGQSGLGSSDDDEVIIRREISQSGSNKVFVNGCLSTQGFLAQLGSLLADIHGQHDQQQLLQSRTHLDFLDAYAQLDQGLIEVSGLFVRLRELQDRVNQVRASEKERLQKIDTLKYQIADIEELGLTPGQDRTLEAERSLLLTAQKRFQHSETAFLALYEREDSVLSILGAVDRDLASLGAMDAAFEPARVRLQECRYQLEELAFQLRNYASRIESSPDRLEEIEERLNLIQKARRKYGDSVDLILTFLSAIRTELDSLLAFEQEGGALARELESLQAAYVEASRSLSAKRREASDGLCKAVEKELADLSMHDTRFEVMFRESAASEKGTDEVEFLISPNRGESLRPLARIASGGELSRIVLALKSVLTLEKYRKTLVFDEIDSGIGGRVASSVGEKLALLADQHQVFCVTHLPQIALQADDHFFLSKRENASRTIIEMSRLRGDARVEELARMLAGEKITESTLQHARELLSGGRPATREQASPS
jgi:DNA repair protein RecN (Recombination protein N)